MDDRQFDHIVKNKLESLDPEYNEQAWKTLDYKLDLLTPLPWYSRWKSLLVAGSLGLITLLNVGLLYKVDREQEKLTQLVNLLSEREQRGSTDTVYLVQENYLTASFLGAADGSTLLASNDKTLPYDLLDPLSVYKITAGAGLSANSVEGIPVVSSEPAATGSIGSSPLMYRQPESVNSLDPFSNQYQLKGPAAEDMYVRGVVLPSRNEKWDYPIQPRIGFAAGYLIPDPDQGEKFVSSRQSLFIESPIRGGFHILTGLSHQEVTYKLDDVDDNNFEQTTLLRYPGFATFTTSPDEITVENSMLQLPLYFRYYKPLNTSWSVFAGGGPTIDILLRQKFIYSFLEIQDEELVEFEEVIESGDVEFNLGSLSANAGIEHYFNSRLSAQVELNYQYGLGKIGLEKRAFNSFAVSGGLFYKLNKIR